MKKVQSFDRSAGILMSVSSLPSPYGIGTFGKAAYDFVDFVSACNHRYWQVLPLGPTTYGDSPYQSYSAFAGNPYFIDLDILVQDGLLFENEVCTIQWSGHIEYVDYERIYNNRFAVLKSAFARFKNKLIESKVKLAAGLPEYKRFDNFIKDNSDWLNDYSLFMALKGYFDNKSWWEWDDDIKRRTPEAVEKYSVCLSDEIEFWKFVQYEFDKQWTALKSYANKRNVEIIGDIPIYMGYDSADVWANTDEYLLDENLAPVKVAGVPPDAFSDLGQKWGNPLYDWKKMKLNGFDWWKRRMQHSSKLYDVIRIDSFYRNC